MVRSWLRHGVLPLVASLALGAGPSVADVAVPPDNTSRAYGVLERLGLLKAEPKPAEPARVESAANKASAQSAGPLTAGVSAAVNPGNGASSQAYQVLRRLGLLRSEDGSLAAKGKSDRVDRVVVEKSKRRLYLLRNGEKYKEYPIVLGAMPRGAKEKAGDLRTPEGVYTLDWRNPRSRYYKSIHISYPSQTDRQRAEQKGVDPGGMVMLHGEHNEPAMRRIYRRTSKDWTEGCIALNNEHMDEIWHVVPDGTPIEIKP